MAKKTVATYDDQNHMFTSHIRELLTKYYVVKNLPASAPVEYIREEYYEELPAEEREQYTTMTQGQLAKLAGIRPNAVGEISTLQRSTLNIYHISAIASALGITDLNQIISLTK